MKKFFCSQCQAQVFFENDQCVHCGQPLGFVPDRLEMQAFAAAGDGWYLRLPAGQPEKYRRCLNGVQHQVCNWMVPEKDPLPFCESCRLNEVIPNLSEPKNLARWYKLEAAKRRCIYSLLRLRLPLQPDPAGGVPALQFRFLAEADGTKPVATGHEAGKITVNIAEADEEERERRRVQLHEPYRTLVGHFRHELGHYYWDRLIKFTPALPRFRELFGDETADYNTAMENYYRQGPAPDWSQRTITAYASMHPWEDWAETWAHYFHIRDTLQTVDSFGLQMVPTPASNPPDAFDALCLRWVSFSCALNAINRGMGLNDLYPFIISPAVQEKLRFINNLIASTQTNLPPPAP